MGSDVPERVWDKESLADPHGAGDKALRVQRMFGAIARSYDLNNRLHSLGMDQHWRKVAVKMAGVKAGDRIVDVACGTGDLTIKLARALVEARSKKEEARRKKEEGRREKQEARSLEAGGDLTQRSQRHTEATETGGVMGVDFTAEMLPLAGEKARRAGMQVYFVQGDAMALALGDGSVDVVTIAFGIRNVADWRVALKEFGRILKPGGRVVVLEFSLPRNRVLRGLYNFYFRKVLPVTATWVSGDKTGAYKYLPESVNTFIGREEMVGGMEAAGFRGVEARAMTFGVCVCYRGVKGG